MKKSFAAILVLLFASSVFAQDEIDYNHRIEDKGENGSVIVLEDDSVWAVNPVDNYKVSVWLTTDEVTVFKSSPSTLYPYLIVDKEHTDDRVHVKYLGHI